LAPLQPKPEDQRLPPMLRRSSRRSMTGYSKGARGLFVLMREIGILTDTAVSPSLRRRQPSSRYAIHAGRNLPDKEFRYLRTVIVTAAVYRGFGTQLRLAANRIR
jgi:3-oxoacyl-(acyl-carrier-protein) synthase